MDRSKPAPKFLNLLRIKLPVGGVASIAHRISGVLMFISIPLLAWLFALSLQNEQGYQAALAYLRSLPLRLLSVVLVWSLSHHLLAGLRHLLLDIDIGVDRKQAHLTAWLVNAGGLALTALYLVSLL
jgi:succinate dehydrogenase / fumarate reductase cytochrome b subunit